MNPRPPAGSFNSPRPKAWHIAAEAVLAFASTVAWGPALVINGVLLFVIGLMIQTSTPNELREFLLPLADRPPLRGIIAWLHPGNGHWEGEAAARLFAEIAGKVSLVIFVVTLPARLLLPRAWQLGFRGKAGLLASVALLELAVLSYLTGYVRLGPNTTQLGMTAVWAAVCLLAFGLSTAALFFSEKILGAIARHLGLDQPDPPPRRGGDHAAGS